MRRFLKNIQCFDHFQNVKRISPFLLVYYQLHYNSVLEDKLLIDDLYSRAEELANAVNPHPANATTDVRDDEVLLSNALAGVVSEFFWELFLNDKQKIVRPTEFHDAAGQIDLVLINGEKRIEVRSSCPRNGIDFAICNPNYEFDILGPYANTTYKPGEVRKDFYVRTLYHLSKPQDILDAIHNDGFNVYLTGGATYRMMTNPFYSKTKTLEPEFTMSKAGEASYKVVPFSRALDTFQIKALIEQASFHTEE